VTNLLFPRLIIAAILVVTPWDRGLAQAPGSAAPAGNGVVIDRSSWDRLPAIIEQMNQAGCGTLVLPRGLPLGPLPVPPKAGAVRVIDDRYAGGTHVIRGNHPRLEGIWPQYSQLGTGLARNVVISDVVTQDMPLESWRGTATRPAAGDANNPYEYPDAHNHYQNLLSEVWNFSTRTNSVAIWGDSGAFVPGAKSWGGFFSARSWPLHWKEYVPPGTAKYEDRDFDATLIGVEIDVLNNGLDWGKVSPLVAQPAQKIGLQVVGFGRRNTAAIEVRSEDTMAALEQLPTPERRGTWTYGMFFHNSMNADSTLIRSSDVEVHRGLDLSETRCTDGAVLIHAAGPSSGLLLEKGKCGEIYGQRARDGRKVDGWLGVRLGREGVRFVGNDAKREIMTIDNDGATRLSGEFYLNGQRVELAGLRLVDTGPWARPTWIALFIVMAAWIAGLSWKVRTLHRRLERAIPASARVG
jgi:hypothetical protein